jgi:hypothetical protein
MDKTSVARGMFTSVREDAVLWPALDCSFKKSIHDELVYQQPLNMDGTSKEWNENPVKVKFINSKNELVEDSFVELVKETMKRVANSYLTNVSMEVETAVKLTWTK